MKPIRTLAAGAALFAALAMQPALAAIYTYSIDVPGTGIGVFQYDSSALTGDGAGNYSTPLTEFSFTLSGGAAYTLADLTAGTAALAWFMDPGAAFVGIQYQSAAFQFDPGIGGGNLGLFTLLPGGGDTPLTAANFTLEPSGGGVPEPGTAALLLLGLGAARLAERARKSRV